MGTKKRQILDTVRIEPEAEKNLFWRLFMKKAIALLVALSFLSVSVFAAQMPI
jgi:hypothetical protein